MDPCRSEGLVRKASKPDMEAEAGQPYKKQGPTQLPGGLGTIGYVQSLIGLAWPSTHAKSARKSGGTDGANPYSRGPAREDNCHPQPARHRKEVERPAVDEPS